MLPLPQPTAVPTLPHEFPVVESFTVPQQAPMKPPQQTRIDPTLLTEELKYVEKCILILDVLESFGTHVSKEPSLPSGRWAGKPSFLGHVFHWVRKNEPVMLTMPAFPCKSANRENKVLGYLPDLGEELAMTRLNSIAVAIKNVYEPGALVNIASDGILFNDIIEVTDEETWEYGEALRDIAKEKGLDYIVFLYPQVLIGMMSLEEMTKEAYLSTADECRALLEARHGSTLAEIEARIKADPDTNSTYCGMVKFLQTELFGALAGKTYKQRQKLQKTSAKRMMQRSEAFTLAIRTYRPMDVRLSMHPSSGLAKLSIALVPSPKGFFQKAPWHSCVAIDSEGGYHCVHSSEVRDTHELTYKGGRPYFFIAKDAVRVAEAVTAPAAETSSDVAEATTPAVEKLETVTVIQTEQVVKESFTPTAVKPETVAAAETQEVIKESFTVAAEPETTAIVTAQEVVEESFPIVEAQNVVVESFTTADKPDTVALTFEESFTAPVDKLETASIVKTQAIVEDSFTAATEK